MRIHGGTFRNHKIATVKSKLTRETSSMVRMAVFNMLGPIKGNVLDLFAGSGSYGFTALSLGANKVYLIDNNVEAIKTLKTNKTKLKIDEKAVIFKNDYLKFLKLNTIKYDYIFLDPPFDYNNYEELIKKVNHHLDDGGYMIVESNAKIKYNTNIEGLELIKSKKYGSKMVNIFIK